MFCDCCFTLPWPFAAAALAILLLNALQLQLLLHFTLCCLQLLHHILLLLHITSLQYLQPLHHISSVSAVLPATSLQLLQLLHHLPSASCSCCITPSTLQLRRCCAGRSVHAKADHPPDLPACAGCTCLQGCPGSVSGWPAQLQGETAAR